jgi:rubrerythrin
MTMSRSFQEVVEFAIDREREAQAVYLAAAEEFKGTAMRDALLEMAEQERRHEDKLRTLDVARFLEAGRLVVPSLDIAEYVVPGDFHAGMTYPDLLTYAMLREKAAYRLYTDLAKVAPDDDARAMFKALAQEEARHKLALEIEYDTNVFQEN